MPVRGYYFKSLRELSQSWCRGEGWSKGDTISNKSNRMLDINFLISAFGQNVWPFFIKSCLVVWLKTKQDSGKTLLRDPCVSAEQFIIQH